ncbi:conserved Plasmodium protein, unknown function [Plasmodium gallinaceum]|uniref:Thioredoxin-like protein n=1 Tax=Plasmodium gallinaceum TaxID=5849 RepID=A0A1J1GVL4_PLAGA|nr:conserved Plasmodium protein, unknown function [Plasmodium gallinaceum]CRG96594.1 conserved Plasmodium protein, unknown function [Plasmodium gallinaceum]
MLKVLNLNKILKKNNSKFLSVISKNYSTIKNDCMKIDNKYIYNVYKLNESPYNNLKIINNYDEYFNFIIKNEYFKDYSEISNKSHNKIRGETDNKLEEHVSKEIKQQNNTTQNELENIDDETYSKNVIISNDLQVLFFGSYENNISIVLFNKFKSIIEKNKNLNFFFIDINICPQCSYNCQINYVPSVILIYKNHIFRKKFEINYENVVDENYLTEFLNKVQQNIDLFHSYNNKFIYSLEKQSNYLNTKYIDLDNQNIHKENWNTF